MQTRTTLCFAFERQKESPKASVKTRPHFPLFHDHIGENESFFSVSVVLITFQTTIVFCCYLLRRKNKDPRKGGNTILVNFLHACMYLHENHACTHICFVIFDSCSRVKQSGNSLVKIKDVSSFRYKPIKIVVLISHTLSKLPIQCTYCSLLSYVLHMLSSIPYII
jgi:hypothetical protein